MIKSKALKEKEKEKLKDYEPKGLGGLVNVGNTCYLNSILQCLLHTPELVIYLNSPKFSEDLEFNKKINQSLSEEEKEYHEYHYELIIEFEKLMKKIWKGYPIEQLVKILQKDKITDKEDNEDKNIINNITINPKFYLETSDFKNALSELFPYFKGKSQQDAHEVLTNILDSFHSALNKTFNENGCLITSRILENSLMLRKTQSYIAYQSHKAVNDSIIEDIFFGQLSSIFMCYKCHNVITENYEAFSSLELTIPLEKNINLFIIPINFNVKDQIKIVININNNMSYDDIYTQISKITGLSFKKYIFYWPSGTNNKTENYKRKSLRSNKNKEDKKNNQGDTNDIIITECNSDKCHNFINSKINELYLMEIYDKDDFVKENPNEAIYEYNIEVKIKSNNNKYNNINNIPRLFKAFLSENDDNHLIYNNIYKYLESYRVKYKCKKKSKISQNENKDSKYTKKNKKQKKKRKTQKDNNQIEENQNDIIEDKKNDNIIILDEDSEISSENKYIIGITCTNFAQGEDIISNEVQCPLCNKKYKKYNEEFIECFCINEFFDNEFKIINQENKKIFSTKLISFINQKNISQKALLNLRIISLSNFPILNFNKFEMHTKLIKQKNLFDLFEYFVAEEKIEYANNCKNCGKMSYAYQKKDIHKFPHVLIIHIKRFKNEEEKNEEKIEFPEEIELSKYNNKGLKGIYSLNSVVFHHGTMINGHYTSMFKFLPNNRWVFCNDTKVKYLNGNKAIGLNPNDNKDDISTTGDGYILFYRIKI